MNISAAVRRSVTAFGCDCLVLSALLVVLSGVAVAASVFAALVLVNWGLVRVITLILAVVLVQLLITHAGRLH